MLSLRVAILATVLNALIGVPLAWALARRRFPGRALLDLLVTMPLILPPTVTGYYLIVLFGRRGWLGGPLYQMTGWSIAFTWYAAALAATIMALPLLVRTAKAAFESVDRDLERAAFTLGRSELRTAVEVALSLQVPGFDLDVSWSAGGGVAVLFGPSGAGKTLTLQCLAGLITPNAGRVVVDGRVLFDSASGVNVPAQARRVGYVFQGYALFPHLTV